MALNDPKVKSAAPGAKPYKLADEGALYLLVQPNGVKLWRMNYRYAGKQKTLAIGEYGDPPKVSLKQARVHRDEAKAKLRDGIDPSGAKVQARAAKKLAHADSFEAIAREWLGKQNHAESTRKKALWIFEVLLFPWIGRSPITAIKAPDLLAALRKTEARSRLESAQRAKQYAGMVFRYAIATGRAADDPSTALQGALATPKTRHRASITDPAQIGPLLRTLHGYNGTFVTLSALKLAPLLMVRPGELRKAEWSDFDLDVAEWRVPATTMKGKTLHLVPLSVQAVAVLRELQAVTGSGRYVFPGVVGRGRPMSENTVLAALRRMGYSGDEMTGHGFRSMASTRLHELGWPHDAIERQLAHKDKNKVSAAYNYAQYLPERRKMMQVWADYLDTLREERKVIVGNFGRAA